jgi:Mg-chelatase subunit ChlD
LIADLQAATTETVENYTQAMDLITADFEARPEGTDAPAFQQLAADLVQTRDTRLAALSGIIEALENLDLTATATVAAKVAEAENLLSREHHVYGEKILHSRNKEGTACPNTDLYQICTLCNDIKWSKGEHQWYYSRNASTHQQCCQLCDVTESADAHDTNEQGQCDVCNYKLKANILIVESIEGESQKLSAMIDKGHTVTTVHIKDSDRMPASIDDLKDYDEVILVNIANKDMPQGFDALLQSYVQDLGRGLLTIGGNTADSTAENLKPNAYDRADMQDTLYQEMLPVHVMDPEASVAVLFIIDCSGSMWDQSGGTPYEQSLLFAEMQCAEASLDYLKSTDYVGILPFADRYDIPELIPRPQRDQILREIDSIVDNFGGGTIFTGALETARRALLANTKVQRRHIIMLTDGLPGDANPQDYLDQAKLNAQAGITMSVVGIGCDNASKRAMIELVKEGGGEEKHFYDFRDYNSPHSVMEAALRLSELREMTITGFCPTIPGKSSIVGGITEGQLPSLGGAYSSQLKDGATEILRSPYGPLLAHWRYGKGIVGSFMCDLNGTWSDDFIVSKEGAEIINNILILLANSSD